MKSLNEQELVCVSGGADIYITYEISTEGLSNQCINEWLMVPSYLANNMSDYDISAKIDGACSDFELDAIFSRMDSAELLHVSYN